MEEDHYQCGGEPLAVWPIYGHGYDKDGRGGYMVMAMIKMEGVKGEMGGR